MSTHPQPGILADVPPFARYLWFDLRPSANARAARALLEGLAFGDHVVGLGPAFVSHCRGQVDGLREPETLQGVGVSTPSTPTALWLWLRGEDPGDVLHASRSFEAALAPAFELFDLAEAFRHREGRDLSGYVDGTENPTGEKARATAIIEAEGATQGSSFVSVQRWRHDLEALGRMAPDERDHVIGRRLADDVEIDDAPASAHVKRTAQEDFDPEAFLVRRSMPWSDPSAEGLIFVAFATSFDPFEAQLRRMVGLDDGIVDALFRFTRPESSAYLWCPPLSNDRLDLSALASD